MRSRTLQVLVSIALVASGALVYAAATTEADTYRVTADVEQAPNLFEGGRVMVRGVEVGKITGVAPRADTVRLTLEIDSNIRVPEGASLSVVPITLISDRYVQLYPAFDGGPSLEEGDHIPLARTTIPAELDDVLAQLKGLLSALEPRAGERGPLARLIEDLDRTFRGKGDELARTIEHSADVFEDLAGSQSDITGLISNLDRLFLALASRSSEIGLINERFALVAEALAADQANLEGTIENLTFLATQTEGLFAESGDRVGSAFGRLSRVLEAVLRRQDELSAGTKWTNVIAQALGATDRRGRGLHAYSGRQAAPGSTGAEYNYRIDSRDTIACERLEVLIDSLTVLNPDATLEELTNTALTFVPETYRDDLEFLISDLIALCADVPGGPPPSVKAAAVVEELALQMGEDELQSLLVGWFAGPLLVEEGS